MYCVTTTYGQEYALRKYTIYDGLPQSQVTCIFEDSRGYLWVGTKGGVSKFNGESFESFTTRDGLPGPFVMDIDEDRNGDILIGIRNEGVVKYDGEQFYHIPFKVESNPRIEIDGKNRIWIFRNLRGSPLLWIIEGNQRIEKTAPFRELDKLNIRYLFWDEANSRMLIIAWDSSLYSFKEGNLQRLNHNGLKKASFPHADKPYIIGINKENKFVLNEIEKDETRALATTLPFKENLQARVNDKNEIYLAYYGGNTLTKINYNTGEKTTFNSPELNFIGRIFIDSENSIW
ncbi:MAG: hypothetical protein GY705_20585, partial [Bacteroidetes bacterium]|nr:hypothetical protein [Bacteroidota bacterium]